MSTHTIQTHQSLFFQNDRYWNQTFGTIKSANSLFAKNPAIPSYGIGGIAWKLDESRTNLTQESSLILRVLQTAKSKVFTVWQAR